MLGSYLPTGHPWHVWTFVAAVAAEKRPDWHSSQIEDAVLASYLPVGHAWHVLTFVAFNAAEKRPG